MNCGWRKDVVNPRLGFGGRAVFAGATAPCVCVCVCGGGDDDVELHVPGYVDILGTNCDQCLSMVQCCFTSTETIRLCFRTEKLRMATSTFTQLLNFDEVCGRIEPGTFNHSRLAQT